MGEGSHHMNDMYDWTQPEHHVYQYAMLVFSPTQTAVTVPNENKHPYSRAAVTLLQGSVSGEGEQASLFSTPDNLI